MLYFAYGSNLDFAQMRGRCPSARFVCVANLPNHRLDFRRKSTTRGCGVADIVAQPGQEVWGVVYEIAEIDFGRLDTSEGYRPGRDRSANAYVREERHVFRDGDEDEPILVWTYVANPQANPPRPNAEYKALIVGGARHWHLPQQYQETLAQIETA